MPKRKLHRGKLPTHRINIHEPSLIEEKRQLAEAIADLHYVISLIIQYADEFIPGEAIEELEVAWQQSQQLFEPLVQRLQSPTANDKDLAKNELTGGPGKAKRFVLSRLKDRFFKFIYSHPYTNKKQARAADAAINYLDYGATVVSSIPGCDAIEEIILLVKQLMSVRAKR